MSGALRRMKGGPELVAFLNAFPRKVQRNALNSGMRKGANIVKDEAKLRAPRKTGKMADGIKVSSPRSDKAGNVTIKVQLTGEHAFLGIFHEYGVAAHVITAAGAGKLTQVRSSGDWRYSARTANRSGSITSEGGVLKIGKDIVTGGVLHPGYSERKFKFMRPALEAKAGEVIDAVGAQLVIYLKNKSGFTAPTLSAEPLVDREAA